MPMTFAASECAAKLLMPMTFAGSECAAKLLIRQSEWRMTFAASDFGAKTGPTNKAATEIAAASARPERLIIESRDRIRLLLLCREKRILLVAFSRKKGFFSR